MRANLRAVAVLVSSLAICAGALAQDPCGECRKAAGAEKQKCDAAAAKSGSGAEDCVKRISEAMLACQLGTCKPAADAQMAQMCPGCQSRVSDEEKLCKSMPPGSAEQMACSQRAGRMKAECEEKFCKHAAPK